MGNTYREKQHHKRTISRGFYSRLFADMRKRAKTRKLAWEIDFNQWLDLIKGDCYLCGGKPANRYKSPPSSRAYKDRFIIYQGIDRVDNAQGYVVGNVKPCCKQCNFIKAGNSLSGLKKQIKKIISYNQGIKFGLFKRT